MARSMLPDSADSQFFICFGDCDWLNGQYTVWGQVTSGMDTLMPLSAATVPTVQSANLTKSSV